MKKLVVVLLIIGMVACGVFGIWQKKAKLSAAPTPASRPTPVRTSKARIGNICETCTFLAQAAPWQQAELASRITAKLVDVVPREGQSVKAGQILVRLEDLEPKSALEAARAMLATYEQNVAYWEKEMERDEMLIKEGAIAQAAYDNTANHLDDARGHFLAQTNKCRTLMASLAYTRILSPFDGVITRRLVDPGDLATAGVPLLIAADLSRLKICFDIPQADVSRVQVGTEVIVKTQDGPISLAISRLYPTLNPDRTLTVEAYSPNINAFRSGAYYTVEVIYTCLNDVVLVPEECLITTPEGLTAVIVIENNRLVAEPVTVAMVRKGEAVVVGVEPDSVLVRSTYLGWNRLTNGERVTVMP